MTEPPNVRLAVCIPSTDTVQADFAFALATMFAKSLVPRFLINVKSSIVAWAYNQMVEQARDLGATHALFLEYDHTFPPDTATRLLAHGKDIVGATYVRRSPPHETLGASLTPFCGNSGLVEMQMMPMGVLLVDLRVFQSMPQPWFGYDVKDGKLGTQDVYFCTRARKAGFRIWCDVALSLQVGHIGQQVFMIPEEAPPAADAA